MYVQSCFMYKKTIQSSYQHNYLLKLSLNPFTLEFLKWTSFLNLANRGFKNRMANSADPDEMGHYELIMSHLIKSFQINNFFPKSAGPFWNIDAL